MKRDILGRTTSRENKPTPFRADSLAVIACQVLKDVLEPLLPEDPVDYVAFEDYGLHRVPGKMTKTLQERIDSIEQPSLVVLGYGLCGNGTSGIHSGKHTLLIPRADDCIALLLGSREAYLREFRAEPATYYLSKGWLDSGSHPLSEYHEYAEKYGAEDAEWILDEQYQNYQRLALVAHSSADLEAYRSAAQEVAEFCARWDMEYQEILGSDDYLRRLVETAVDVPKKGMAAAEQVSSEFVVVAPGDEIRQDAFIG